MRIFLASAVLAFSVCAHATTFSSDFTDLWWNESEDGWGANVVQQDNVLFMTFLAGPSTRTPRPSCKSVPRRLPDKPSTLRHSHTPSTVSA